MIVDDHAIDSLNVFFSVAYDELKKEWHSNRYERLSHCPSFKAAYTYREALNILIKGPYSIDETQLKKMIEEDIEIENLKKKE